MIKILEKKSHKTAFSLIELSIIIALISIVIAGAVSVSTSRVINQKASVGNTDIDAIYRALGKYVLTNKKFPCPAAITDIKDSSLTYGQSVTTAYCNAAGVYTSSSNSNLIYGMVPTNTLGLNNQFAEDAYGNKIVYVIDKRLTSTAAVVDSDLNDFENSILEASEYSSGAPYTNITISGSVGGATSNNALFILMSRGANQSAAYAALSAQPSASIANESSNDLASFDGIFLGSSASSDFDDVVFYKSRDQMFDDFNLWQLIPCPGSSSTLTHSDPPSATSYCSKEDISWPKAYPGQIISTENGNGGCDAPGWHAGPAYPSRKCGIKGAWGEIINACTAENVAAKNCYAGSCQRLPTTNYGGNAVDPTPDYSYVASGESIKLICIPGYGKALSNPKSFRALDSHETHVCTIQNDGNYGFSTTDRIPDPPTSKCLNGVWQPVVNPCSSCRNCSKTTNAQAYVVERENNYSPRSDGACYGQYRTGKGFPGNYDCYTINGVKNCKGNVHSMPLVSSSHFDDQAGCQYQEHGNDSSGNILARCLDGRYYGIINCDGGTGYGNGHNNRWLTPCTYRAPSFGAPVNYDGSNCDSDATIVSDGSVNTSFDKNMSGCDKSRTLSAKVYASCVAAVSLIPGQSYICHYSDNDSVNNGVSGPARCSHSWSQHTYYTFTCEAGNKKRLSSSYCEGSCGSGATSLNGTGITKD